MYFKAYFGLYTVKATDNGLFLLKEIIFISEIHILLISLLKQDHFEKLFLWGHGCVTPHKLNIIGIIEPQLESGFLKRLPVTIVVCLDTFDTNTTRDVVFCDFGSVEYKSPGFLDQKFAACKWFSIVWSDNLIPEVFSLPYNAQAVMHHFLRVRLRLKLSWCCDVAQTIFCPTLN